MEFETIMSEEDSTTQKEEEKAKESLIYQWKISRTAPIDEILTFGYYRSVYSGHVIRPILLVIAQFLQYNQHPTGCFRISDIQREANFHSNHYESPLFILENHQFVVRLYPNRNGRLQIAVHSIKFIADSEAQSEPIQKIKVHLRVSLNDSETSWRTHCFQDGDTRLEFNHFDAPRFRELDSLQQITINLYRKPIPDEELGSCSYVLHQRQSRKLWVIIYLTPRVRFRYGPNTT